MSWGDHQARMDRMRRHRERLSKAVCIIILLIISGGLWLLFHPEQIGTFVGQIATGFQASQ